MGDIIGSETNRLGGALSEKFNVAVDAANKRFHADLLSPLTITLGDEFQGFAGKLTEGFRILVKVRADLLETNVECRFVLGLAYLDTHVNRRSAWNMMGEGLAKARDKLNDKRDPNVYRFSIINDPGQQRLLDAVGFALTRVERRWTDKQRRYAYFHYSKEETIEQVAERFKVSPRAVYKVLAAGETDYYNAQKKAVMDALSFMEREHKMR
jgi:hypothetical protein